MIIVTVENGGIKWYLKSTTWTSLPDRADSFDSLIVAKAAVEKAKKFMKPLLFKKKLQYENKGV